MGIVKRKVDQKARRNYGKDARFLGILRQVTLEKVIKEYFYVKGMQKYYSKDEKCY